MNHATPPKTPAEKSALAQLSGGRISVALLELKRRLQTELPAQIAYENARLGLTGNDAFIAPTKYGIAPSSDLLKGVEKHLLVGATTVRKAVSGTRAFRNVVMLQIHNIGERGDGEKQVLGRYDVAEIIAVTIAPYLTGCIDPLDRVAWRELAPDDTTALPSDWKQLSGLTLNYQLIQSPDDDLWTPATE